MRKLILLLFVLIALALPCQAFAATVSGVLNQLTLHYTRPLENITITLENENGAAVKDVTDSEGRYRFTGVNPGRYRISAALPSDHVPAMKGSDNALLPAKGNRAVTDWFDVNGNVAVNLASTRSSVFVRCLAFVDENANGGRMTSEPLLKDVQVALYAAGDTDTEIASGATDRKGEITFSNLSPGQYLVRVIMPENYSVGPLGSKVSIYYNCIKPSESQEAWSDVFTVSEGSQGLAIGAVVTGSAQGRIWYDADADGRRGANESGFAGVTVQLVDSASGLTRTAVTDAGGAYSFSKLQPGEYTVKITAPAGSMFAAPGGDSWLTEGYSDTDQGTIRVAAEKVFKISDIGLMDATGLRIVCYHDTGADGKHDAQDPAASGVNVRVTRDGQSIAEMTSGEDGTVEIPIIRAGDIKVSVQLNGTDIFSWVGPDNDFALPTAGSASEIALTLNPGETKTVSAAITQPAQIGGLLFMDHNDNGIRESEDEGVAGFTVQAVDWSGNVAAETVTDAGGHYMFDCLQPIPHTVRFLLNDPYISSPAAQAAGQTVNTITHQNGDYGETEELTLLPGSFIAEVNGAIFKAGTISGRIRLSDERPQGMPDALEGMTVTLETLDGNPVSDYTTVLSEADGTYYLKGILPGEYRLRYTLPEDSLFADTDEPSVYSVPFTSAMGTDTQIADVIAVRTATIEGQVLCEGAPADAMITAVNAETGYTVSFPAEAASAGHFALRLLRPGTWNVTVTLGEGFSFAEDTDLVPAKAYHVSEQTYTLEMAEAMTDQKVLVTRPATMSGRVFQDENLSGAFDADETLFAGLAVSLINRDNETVAELETDAEGRFESPKIVPGRYRIAIALDDDCILPDGVQLSLEQWAKEADAVSGQNTDVNVPVLRFASIGGRLWSLDDSLDFVAGLEVQLFRADDTDAAIAVAKTDAKGQYRFARLYPGDYRLTVNLPEGHGFARRSDTNEQHVSLILSNDESTISDVLSIHMGINITNADFGFGAKGSIGDLAWLDENGNGMQDIGEKGIPGIRLQLMQDGELLAEAETDLYGHYMFENIYPGHYTLRVTMYPELTATAHQTEFPLIGSVLPESDELTVDAEDVIVPSGTRNLAVDIGFKLRKSGVYPAVMDTIPTMDWSFGGKKR